MEKIYKVFVSSTFTDLEEERKEVIQALLQMDCVPSGMEMFHATDKSQWLLIQNVISSCDFYIVIIAGRYGSVHSKTNISYTQMEYEYAYKIGIPILAFIYKTPDDLPARKIESNPKYQKKLEEFKKRILDERTVNFWINSYDLASSVKASIFQAIKNDPPGGWVRYKDIVDNNKDNINTSEMVKQINELKNIILTYHNVLENEKRKNNINNSNLLNQLNEFKSTIISSDTHNTNNNISSNIKKDVQKYKSNYTCEYIYQISSKNITFSLNSIHISALEEITNMMFSAGITGLSMFFNIPIKADFTYFQLCKNFNDIQKIIDTQNKYCMLSDFYTESWYSDDKEYGKIYGKIYLNFNVRIVEKITSFLSSHYFKYISNHEYDYLKSAIHELSSIFIGASLTALSVIINAKAIMSATINNIDIKKINLLQNDEPILISKFSNSINEPNLFDAYLILEPTSLKDLLEQTFGEPIM